MRFQRGFFDNMQPIDISQSQEIYTVTRLNREVRFILEGSFPLIWIEGEISNFSAPSSGHWYFSLKDKNSQVRCAMFRMQNRQLNFIPKDGMHVLAKVRISMYEGRGEFQLLVDLLEDAGVGKLQKEFEALKKRLNEQGFFSPANKKSLPNFPSIIGVITSPTGAVIQDILNVLKRRYPVIPIVLYPTLVQGSSAAAHIVQAIQKANQRKECDVLLLARGGGSLEDLWPFNEEIVAHAIFNSTIPIISGVGHEVDFTIADFVADVRAPTPSAAAELLTPHIQDLRNNLRQLQKKLIYLFNIEFQKTQQLILWLTKHLKQLHPQSRLKEKSQQLDVYELKLVKLKYHLLNKLQNDLHIAAQKLHKHSPLARIHELQHHLQILYKRLQMAMNNSFQKNQQLYTRFISKLDTLSPLATLHRGFALVIKNKTIISSIHQVTVGDQIQIKLNDGELTCMIEEIKKS